MVVESASDECLLNFFGCLHVFGFPYELVGPTSFLVEVGERCISFSFSSKFGGFNVVCSKSLLEGFPGVVLSLIVSSIQGREDRGVVVSWLAGGIECIADLVLSEWQGCQEAFVVSSLYGEDCGFGVACPKFLYSSLPL